MEWVFKISRLIILMAIAIVTVFSCSTKILDEEPMEGEDDNYGIARISFNFNIPSLPRDRVKRADLSIAYTADSAYRGQFFDSANVSDSVSAYYFKLLAGEYFFVASIVCLCEDDSCMHSGFQGQYALRQTASKFQVRQGETSFYNTQFQ
jgi:hypothetical protein